MILTISERTTAMRIRLALVKLYKDKALTDRLPAVEVTATMDGKRWWHYRLVTRYNGAIEANAFRHGQMIVVDGEPGDPVAAAQEIVRKVTALSGPETNQNGE